MQLGLVLPLLALAAAPEVVARVDGRPLAAATLEARRERVKGMHLAVDGSSLVEALVQDSLLAAEAARRGVDREPATAALLDAERRHLALQRFEARELTPRDIDEKTLRQLHHDTADSVRLKLASFTTQADAQAALERVRKTGDFAAEARRSVDPRSLTNGGDLGALTRLQLPPELAAAAFAAPLRTPTGPVALSLGFAVIEVLERHVATEQEFQAKRAQVLAFAARNGLEVSRKHLAQVLRAKAKIEVDHAFIAGTGGRLDGTPEEQAHVVARLDGQPIRWGEVLPELQRTLTGGGHMVGPAVKTSFVMSHLDRRVLEAEAVRRGHADAPDLAPALEEARLWVLGGEMRERLRRTAAAPSEPELRARYAAEAARYLRPERRTCWHLEVESRGEAEAARKRIAAGEPFEAVAKALSTDAATRDRGGLLGDLDDEGLKALERAAPAVARTVKGLAPGEVSKPVAEASSYHLFRCGPRVPAGPAPFEDVRADVAARLAAERGDAAVAKGIAALRAAARVTVDEEAVRRIGVATR